MFARLLSRRDAASYCGVSSVQFGVHVAPYVHPIAVGKKRVWDVRALDKWIDERSGLEQVWMSGERWLDRLDDLTHTRRKNGSLERAHVLLPSQDTDAIAGSARKLRIPATTQRP
jgi:hypothetical protein